MREQAKCEHSQHFVIFVVNSSSPEFMHFEMKKDVLLGRCTLRIRTYIKMH